MYILLDEQTVKEIIPDIDPVFPGVPITDRYAPDFVYKLMHVSDDVTVAQNDIYDPETQTFAPQNIAPNGRFNDLASESGGGYNALITICTGREVVTVYA